MKEKPFQPPLPPWALKVGSALIVLHLLALGALVLAAQSGPWPNLMSGQGTVMGPPPDFAQSINEKTMPNYLQYLQMTHNYRFTSNRFGSAGVQLKAVLKDDQGKVIREIILPDPNANPAVRERQEMLARMIAMDEAIPGQEEMVTETIPPALDKRKKAMYWEYPMENGRIVPGALVLDHMEDTYFIRRIRDQRWNYPVRAPNEPRPDVTIIRPSKWSLILLRSYNDYLKRTYNARTVEFTRREQFPIPVQAVTQPQTREQLEAVSQQFSSVREFRYGNIENFTTAGGQDQ